MAEERQGKSTVKFSEWKIERSGGRIVCAKYETVTVDGSAGVPAKVREVPVQGPDLTGADVELIARFATRFGFIVSDLADQCRESDYQRNASRLRASLVEADKKNPAR